MIVDSDCADAFSRRVLRVSAGAALDLTIVESGDLCRDLAELKTGHGFRLVATVTDRAAAEIEAAPVHEKLVITFGNEGFGLDQRVRDLCDDEVTIRLHAGVDSLNVGTASGIFLHHYTRRQNGVAARPSE